MIETKQQIYDELSRVLTNYEEDDDNSPNDLYYMLVKIQNRWEDIIASQE